MTIICTVTADELSTCLWDPDPPDAVKSLAHIDGHIEGHKKWFDSPQAGGEVCVGYERKNFRKPGISMRLNMGKRDFRGPPKTIQTRKNSALVQ